MSAEQVAIPSLDQVLHLTRPLGIDEAAVAAIGEGDLSVEGLASEFEQFVDGITEPPYDLESVVMGDINRPTIKRSGVGGEEENRRELDVSGNYNTPEIPIAEYVSGFSGPLRRATLRAPYLLEEGEDPSVLSLMLRTDRHGFGGSHPRNPAIFWKLKRVDLATGKTVLKENSGSIMTEEGAKGMENMTHLTTAKGLIFKLGVEAIKNFDTDALKPVN